MKLFLRIVYFLLFFVGLFFLKTNPVLAVCNGPTIDQDCSACVDGTDQFNCVVSGNQAIYFETCKTADGTTITCHTENMTCTTHHEAAEYCGSFACSSEGGTCSGAGDCCAGLVCQAGKCQNPFQGCTLGGEGDSCNSNANCCDPLPCINKLCGGTSGCKQLSGFGGFTVDGQLGYFTNQTEQDNLLNNLATGQICPDPSKSNSLTYNSYHSNVLYVDTSNVQVICLRAKVSQLSGSGQQKFEFWDTHDNMITLVKDNIPATTSYGKGYAYKLANPLPPGYFYNTLHKAEYWYFLTIPGVVSCSAAASTLSQFELINSGGPTPTPTPTPTPSPTPGPLSWFQSGGGDVHGNSNVGTTIPITCILPLCTPYFSLDPAGVVSTGQGFGGNISSRMSSPPPGWQVVDSTGEQIAGFGVNLTKYDYTYFYNKLGIIPGTTPPFDGSKPNPPAGQTGIYFVDTGGGTIATTGGWNVGSNEKIIIVVKGNLVIQKDIDIAVGGFLAFIVSGDIIVDKTLGINPVANWHSFKTIEGVYIADGFFRSLAEGDNSNKILVGYGVFVADANLDGIGGFDLRRDTGVDDATMPSEYFEYRPDFLVNFPTILGTKKISVWREVAP